MVLPTSGLIAQNYNVLQAKKKFLYKTNSGYMYTILVDSVEQQGEDLVFHLLKTIQEVDYYCFIPDGPSWMGEKILIHPNGESLFYNINNETISIKTQAGINDWWTCYSSASISFRATVTSIEMGEILGFPDSLKTISFQAFNTHGLNIQHPVNDMQVVLSKNYGMQKTLNFYNFPQHEYGFFLEELKQMTISGFNLPEAGTQNLLWKQVHEFEIGDIFHVESLSNSITARKNSQLIQRVLNKQVQGDTIAYEMENKVTYSNITNENSTFTATIDTSIVYIGSYPKFDIWPGVAYHENGLIAEGYDINHMRQGPHEVNKLLGSIAYVAPSYDSCFNYINVDGCVFNYEYIKGLGGPYYYCDFPPWDRMERKLVYYKKGDTEWGTPLEFNVGIESTGFFESLIGIYPNPTSGITHFSCPKVGSPLEIRIYSITGKEVLFQIIDNPVLDLSYLPEGLYLVKISCEDFCAVRKLLKR
jgi:DNA-binding transcriptional regulator/RsmH inhibitor MraZ